MNAEYSFRAADASDFDFVFALHRAAMRQYIEPIWGWHEDWQEEYLRKKYEPDCYQIIQVKGQDAGVLVVEQRRGEVYLGLIELLPEFQGRGIGTAIVTRLMDESHARGLPLLLHVLKTNEAAQRLYERLGFETVEDQDVRFHMRYPPAARNELVPDSLDPNTTMPSQETQ